MGESCGRVLRAIVAAARSRLESGSAGGVAWRAVGAGADGADGAIFSVCDGVTAVDASRATSGTGALWNAGPPRRVIASEPTMTMAAVAAASGISQEKRG